ncbi:MAG: amidohydrolase family protein [bacterium]
MLKNANLFNGKEKNLKEKAAILIENERITKILEAPSDEDISALSKEYEVGEIIDVKEHVVMPGLIDCHIHLDMHGMADTFDENFVEDKLRSIRAAKEMEKTLMCGITTVRNCGSVNWIDITVKEAIDRGIIHGPRVLTSGKIICITSSGTDYFCDLYREADGYVGFKNAAREQIKMGADFLKIMATGAIMNPGSVAGATQPDLEEIVAVVEEAGKLNKKVAAHAHGAEGIKIALEAGVDTIEHGTFADDEVHQMMIDKQVYLIPTLAPDYYMTKFGKKGGVAPFMVEKLKEKKEARIESLSRAVQNGVKIAVGSDAGTPYNYHKNNANELMVIVNEGIMSAADALVCATNNSSEACGISDNVGTLEPGKIADIVVVKGNPLANIEVLTRSENILLVMKEGVKFKNLIG